GPYADITPIQIKTGVRITCTVYEEQFAIFIPIEVCLFLPTFHKSNAAPVGPSPRVNFDTTIILRQFQHPISNLQFCRRVVGPDTDIPTFKDRQSIPVAVGNAKGRTGPILLADPPGFMAQLIPEEARNFAIRSGCDAERSIEKTRPDAQPAEHAEITINCIPFFAYTPRNKWLEYCAEVYDINLIFILADHGQSGKVMLYAVGQLRN